jgi:predicted N-acyltransferase
MEELARKTGAWLMVFKELDNASPFADALSRRGYVRGAIPPMHLFDAPFPSFAAYRDALKSRYRAQVLRSQKKLAAAGFETLCGRGAAFLMRHFGDRAHRLYMAVRGKAKHKLELLPADFFRELAAALGDEVLLTVIRRGQQLCAFTFAITRGNCHYNMYSGVDYTLNGDGDLYFNLFYQDIDQALRAGADQLHLGQTSDSFKSRLGSRTLPLWFYARARSAAANRLLRWLAPLAFPRVEKVEQHDVFKTPPRRSPPAEAVKRTRDNNNHSSPAVAAE